MRTWCPRIGVLEEDGVAERRGDHHAGLHEPLFVVAIEEMEGLLLVSCDSGYLARIVVREELNLQRGSGPGLVAGRSEACHGRASRLGHCVFR